MGIQEGRLGSLDGATGAAEYLRRDNPGSPTALDYGSLARYVQLPERGFRIV